MRREKRYKEWTGERVRGVDTGWKWYKELGDYRGTERESVYRRIRKKCLFYFKWFVIVRVEGWYRGRVCLNNLVYKKE